MNDPITIAYITMRKEPNTDWFLKSLQSQITPEDRITVVVIDFFYDEYPTWIWDKKMLFTAQVEPPKPCVWQGKHRLTKDNWFAASNARNTALCHALTGWIVFLDDLSVLMPGWLNSVREAMAGNYIALGAYKKVKNLIVENGVPISYTEFPEGIDSRWNAGSDCGPVPASGGMMYGCSVAMPVEALLTINGWPEDLCDGLGSEDYCCGLALQNAGYTFKYDRRMLTLESEEDHHVGTVFRKDDWHFENGVPVRGGNGSDDKSHAALNIARQSKYFPNHFNIRELRQKILSGEPFPVDRIPEHDWYTGIPLKDL